MKQKELISKLLAASKEINNHKSEANYIVIPRSRIDMVMECFDCSENEAINYLEKLLNK